jgi:signal transduction histidine kinase
LGEEHTMDEIERDEVPARLLDAAQRLAAAPTPQSVLQRAVELAPGILAAQHASVTIRREASWVTGAASGFVPERLDAAQYLTGEGPCLTAVREGHRVDVTDLATERRWPAFTASVPAQRVRSVLSVPLHDGERVLGSLNLSAATPDAFAGAGGTADALAAVTGLALAAATARQQIDELTRTLAHTEHFLAGLAHDLRGGMSTALTASAVVAHRRWQLDRPGQEALDLLVDELAREHRLLVDLLNLTRASTEADLQPSTTLLALVQDVLRQRRRRIQVQTHEAADSTEVAVHPVQVRRILTNLLDNADRHGAGAVRVEIRRIGDHAHVAVEDAGPGVPADQREAIFQRFRAPKSAARSETHLGLALSHGHARAAGGDLRVEDRPGGGARFVLVLPVSQGGSP